MLACRCGCRCRRARARGSGSGVRTHRHSAHQLFAGFSLLAFACAASHSAFVSSRKPALLQAFWPLQAFFAVLQADWPLHALTPSHFSLPSSAAETFMEAVANSMAAAAASASVEDLRALISYSFEAMAGRSCMD